VSAPVRSERRGAVAVVTIERPERMNALSRASVEELGRIGRELTGDTALVACVLTGAGDKAFCAGADLKQLGLYRSELAWLSEAPFVTVAAINGAALGGGLELALCCDLRVAAEGAVLGLPETGLGIIPAAGGTQRLPRLVGTAKAIELVLRQTRLSAREALDLGLVNRVTKAGSPVLDDTLSWLEPVTAGAPIAQRSALRALRQALALPLTQGLVLELEAYEACLSSEDRQEALAAFQEKRKPVFKGR
jgi:enoyl-CoA hydratase/carnithine racemase